MSRLCACGRLIPHKVSVDGIVRELRNRRHCLACVPFRGENNRDITKIAERSSEDRTARFRRWQEKARRERKAELVAMQGGQCARCGYHKCVAALEFHHRDPTEKRFNVNAASMLRRWEEVVEEARKCDLL